MHIVIKIYDWLKRNAAVRYLSLAVLTAGLICGVMNLTYKEDISDFLPVGSDSREALSIYQSISGAERIVVLFENHDEDSTIEAIEAFCEDIQASDSEGYLKNLTYQFDIENVSKIVDFAYQNIPYFLTDKDYQRIDSVLSEPDYIRQCMDSNLELLMFPGGSLLSSNVTRDPLNLFTPVVQRLQENGQQSAFDTSSGYLFTRDQRYAIVLIESPFGNSETEMNSKLLAMLEGSIEKIKDAHGGINIKIVGGPQIAVGNASQIKADSILAISLSALLIVLLLFSSIRSKRNIFLIVLSIAWGWLFALGGIALFRDNVSIIVIGISSVILGIAVNYPLHLITHTQHEPNIRSSLKDIMVPLIVGNVTTVGAFFSLIPLPSVALRDLGVFASLLLVGTILFVLIYLPHFVKIKENIRPSKIERLVDFKLEGNKWLVMLVVVATCVLAMFSNNTEFDSNMANINYMTDEQKADMAYFQQMMQADSVQSNEETLFIVSKGDNYAEALAKNEQQQSVIDSLTAIGLIEHSDILRQFLPSIAEQKVRLSKWNDLAHRIQGSVKAEFTKETQEKGFATDAFNQFWEITDAEYSSKNFDYFTPLVSTIFAGNVCQNKENGKFYIVEKAQVDKNIIGEVSNNFSHSFDVRSMNSSLAENLSSNFNYIGLACSVIVFLFLWISFGHIELAILSFIPMAVSWLWILGIMALLGIKFNIVNIILATFIFGQGDDYTIFMTEGCCYEYARRKKVLSSYKGSIILSALIMFAGIGTLIFAKHPALRSLAEVTIVGMFCVVFMAYLFPPLIFNWLVKYNGRYRRIPLKFTSLLRTWYSGTLWLLQLLIGYVIGFVMLVILRPTKRNKMLFHKLVSKCHMADLKLIPGIKHEFINEHNETFEKPCVIACNHQSMLDPMYLMALSPKILIVANRHSSFNPVIRVMFRWLNFYTVTEDKFAEDVTLFQKYVAEGYSIAIFPEGERNPNSTILRFHKGVFHLAQKLDLEIVPIYLHGLNYLMPRHSFACGSGKVTIKIGERIGKDSPLWSDDQMTLTKNVHQFYKVQYQQLSSTIENAAFFAQLVKDRYRYKGSEIYQAVAKNLKHNKCYADIVDTTYAESTIVIENCGYGEAVLLMALVHTDKTVIGIEQDADKAAIAQYSAKGLLKNAEIFHCGDVENIEQPYKKICL